MCIIIDANAIADLKEPTLDGAPVLQWMLTGKGAMMVGGHVRRELGKSQKMLNTMATLNQAGRLHSLDDKEVDRVTKEITDSCCSDDPHVIAVALISGCRLVFSRDKDLHKDLQNKDILTPKAAIYQNRDHKHLLTECKCGK